MRRIKSLLCIMLVLAVLALAVFVGFEAYHITHVHRAFDVNCPICNVIASYAELKLVLLIFLLLLWVILYVRRVLWTNAFSDNTQLITPITLRVKLLD